jgi:hypothetical protein
VGRSHTKRRTKIFFVDISTFCGLDWVFKGPERLYTKNFSKIPIGEKSGKNVKLATFVWEK